MKHKNPSSGLMRLGLLAVLPLAAHASHVLLEAEQFADSGGWGLDQQAMEVTRRFPAHGTSPFTHILAYCGPCTSNSDKPLLPGVLAVASNLIQCTVLVANSTVLADPSLGMSVTSMLLPSLNESLPCRR